MQLGLWRGCPWALPTHRPGRAGPGCPSEGRPQSHFPLRHHQAGRSLPRPPGPDGACLRVLPGPSTPHPQRQPSLGQQLACKSPLGLWPDGRETCVSRKPALVPTLSEAGRRGGSASHPAPWGPRWRGQRPSETQLLGRGEGEGQATRTAQQHTQDDAPAVSARGSPNPTFPHSSRSALRLPGPQGTGGARPGARGLMPGAHCLLCVPQRGVRWSPNKV